MPGSTGRLRSLVALAALCAVSLGATFPIPSAADSGLLTASTLTPSRFSPDGDGVLERTRLRITLSRPAEVTIRVADFRGTVVRRIASRVARVAGTHGWGWNGRSDAGRVVADGFYRITVRATDASASDVVVLGVTKAPDQVDIAHASDITVVLNPGHGGRDPGAVYGGYEEQAFNLDIALQVQAMLELAGVRVVMLRTEDVAINVPPSDVTGDGTIEQRDELAARNDIANLARGDVYVSFMNNAYGCHCVRGTETYTNGDRTWTPEAVDLARFIHRAHLRRLQPFATSRWRPVDRGVRLHDFYVMRPYKRGVIPRPALMPSVLVESLFMDHPNELATLARPSVRTALAMAYLEGIARYFAGRPFGVRYDVDLTPVTAPAGGSIDHELTLVNTGNAVSSGWVLEARAVPAVPHYDGSPTRGALLGEVAVPDGLVRGASTAVRMASLGTPATPGDWLVKFDVRLPDGTYVGDHGVVGPQLPLTTRGDEPPPTEPPPTEPPATEAPSTPSPTEGPSVEPSAEVGTTGSGSPVAGHDPDDGHDHEPELPVPGPAATEWRRYITWQVDYDPWSRLGHHHHGDE